ncbi:MAG: hypothetical protein GY854_08800 [Deltaproteobacteria bacterium]|nr:hypothetical protein [Deltaproteobacteria bacterium]
MKRIIQGLILLFTVAGLQNPTLANEFTDVIDAADTEFGDPFDLNLTIGYERFQKTSVIRRENFGGEPHDWDYFAYDNMFKSKQVTHILNMNLEVGLYHDISFRFRLPLILNDTRELTAHSGWNKQWRDTDDDGIANQAKDALFSVPFKSPTRSGVDHFAMGLWWGILAQDRDDTKPNWTVFVETRIGVGDTLEASCESAQLIPEAYSDGEDFGGGTRTCEAAGYDNKGGVSRGLNELAFGTRFSRRYGILDPYFGIEALIGWAKDGTAFFVTDGKAGQINTMPPVVGTLDFGLEIIPWEVPEKDLKFSITVGSGGKYYSEGREYTPLFDALGTSSYLMHPESTDFNGDGEPELDTNPALNSWSGVTDVENYAMFQGKLILMIQPAKYVKFHIGTQLAHETEHFITKTDQCTSGNLVDGVCNPYNQSHRPAIDAPGNRFRAEKTLLWNFFIDATAMF